MFAGVRNAAVCMLMPASMHHTRTCILRQGDDFAAGLAEGNMLQGDHFGCLRLSACGISDEGACKLAKALERVGEWRPAAFSALLL